MNRVRPHAAIAFAAAAALVVLLAGPAAAIMPDGTAVLTVTSDNPAKEDTTATIEGDCPAGTTQAVVTWSWTDGSGSHTLTSPFVVDPLVGTFSNFYYFSNWVGRGVAITFDLVCSDAVLGTLATANQPYTQPDFGQTVTVPATVAINAGVMATVNCPSAGVNQLFVTPYHGATELTSQWITYTGPGTYNLGTPTSLGIVAGDAIDIYIDCVVTGDSNLYASTRKASYSAVAAAVVTPPTSGGTRGAGLADTGSELGWQSAAAGAMAILGMFLTLWARTRRRDA